MGLIVMNYSTQIAGARRVSGDASIKYVEYPMDDMLFG